MLVRNKIQRNSVWIDKIEQEQDTVQSTHMVRMRFIYMNKIENGI